jgi:hypothetical protein
MPKILVLNYHVSLPPVSTVPSRYPNPLARVSQRSLWYVESGDIVVSPVVLQGNLVEYVAQLAGFDPDTVTILVAGQKLYDDVLLDPDLVASLRAHVSPDAEWMLSPCNVTEGVAELARILGIGAGQELAFAAERGNDLLNSKSHFRQLAAGAGLPIADGVVARSPLRLLRAIEGLSAATGTVIIKQDNAAGGAGNYAFTSGALRPLPGVHEVRPLPRDLADATVLWEELTEAEDPVLVVESYYDATHTFYLEYHAAQGGRLTFLNHGELKRRIATKGGVDYWHWIGLELPSSLRPSALAQALMYGSLFAKAVADVGYRGYMNIDGIVDRNGRVIFNEINARWGGGLVLHTIGSRLLGPSYADTHIVSSLRNVRPAPFAETVEVLQRKGIYFDPQSREGVLVVAHGPNATDDTECVVIAASQDRILQLADLTAEALDESPVATLSGVGER